MRSSGRWGKGVYEGWFVDRCLGGYHDAESLLGRLKVLIVLRISRLLIKALLTVLRAWRRLLLPIRSGSLRVVSTVTAAAPIAAPVRLLLLPTVALTPTIRTGSTARGRARGRLIPHIRIAPRRDLLTIRADRRRRRTTRSRRAAGFSEFRHEVGVVRVETTGATAGDHRAVPAAAAGRTARLDETVRVTLRSTVASHMTRRTADTTDDPSRKVTLLRTVVLAMPALSAILADLVLVVPKGTVQSGELAELITFVVIFAFGCGRGLEM